MPKDGSKIARVPTRPAATLQPVDKLPEIEAKNLTLAAQMQLRRQVSGSPTVQRMERLQRLADTRGKPAPDQTARQTAQMKGASTHPSLARKPGSKQRGPQGHAAPVQMKPIMAGKLNVAGERHPESNPRRAEETGFVATKGFGADQYFKENEYKYSITTAKFSLFGKAFMENTTEHFGDPAILRVEKRIGDTKEKLLPWVADFAAGRMPAQLQGKIPSIEAAWNSFTRDAMTRELNQIRLTMMQLLEVSGEEHHVGKLESLYGVVDEARKDFQSRPDVADVPADAKAFQTLWSRIETMYSKAIKGGAPLASVDAVDKQRSVEMDKSAEASAVTPAVWKVGQSHIDDIKGAPTFDEDALNYNILERGEFNDEFFGWAVEQCKSVAGQLAGAKTIDEGRPFINKIRHWLTLLGDTEIAKVKGPVIVALDAWYMEAQKRRPSQVAMIEEQKLDRLK